MTTIGLSYSLVKISTKCAPALEGGGGHGGLHGVAGRKRLTGAGYRGRGIPAWGADKPGGGILPLGAVSVMLLTTIPLAQVGGHQHLWGLVNMAHHQRHGGSTLGLNHSRDHG